MVIRHGQPLRSGGWAWNGQFATAADPNASERWRRSDEQWSTNVGCPLCRVLTDGLTSVILLTMNPDPTQQLAAPLTTQREAVNLRSVLLGLVGVDRHQLPSPPSTTLFWPTPTWSAATLPTGLLLFLMLFVILVNAPLHRFAPRYAYSSGELAVAAGHDPGELRSGLPRPDALSARRIWSASSTTPPSVPNTSSLLRKANLSDWLFPSYASSDIAQRGNDPIVQQYVGRALTETDTFAAHFQRCPLACLAPAGHRLGHLPHRPVRLHHLHDGHSPPPVGGE